MTKAVKPKQAAGFIFIQFRELFVRKRMPPNTAVQFTAVADRFRVRRRRIIRQPNSNCVLERPEVLSSAPPAQEFGKP